MRHTFYTRIDVGVFRASNVAAFSIPRFASHDVEPLINMITDSKAQGIDLKYTLIYETLAI